MLHPCVSLRSVSSRPDRSGQTKPLAICYSAISRDNGWSIPLYPDLPAGVNFHKRIQISRPRRNLTIPESARLPDEISLRSIELARTTLSLSLLFVRPHCSPSRRSKSTCALFLNYRSSPLWRRTLHYSAIPSQPASFRSRRTYVGR